ncbi:membrane protein PM19L isoform X2 [Ziziphus jujuba]|uniref:Membrane protein PM19L isoform X2 n=1 Tax=Ziziphus jujuba TaxID=326968 RepID=A0A6P6G3V7_ZIZJJ|nr:membrane protein PM19L isoform X2 [Ziziphus jujuba]
MAVVGRGVRDLIGPLLVVNFVVCLIVVGLAGWSIDKYINGEQNHPPGVLGFCSLLSGFIHLRAWRSDSLASAQSLSAISWAITAIAFGFVCKEIILGGHRGKRLRTLETFIVISLLSQFLYVVLLHGGVYHSRYGPGYRNFNEEDHGTAGVAIDHQHQKPDTPAEI